MSVNITTFSQNGRLHASSGSKWEPKMGYSRAVRAGNHIYVTGSVGINADGTYPESLAGQTERSIEIILAAIKALGGKTTDVVRTRIYTTNISQWEQIAGVHGKVFGDIRPATTIVGVARLIDDAAMIEIEADAVVGD
jgi:enamine deaminase RidA (YjgF/YER057c/UK114 family)